MRIIILLSMLLAIQCNKKVEEVKSTVEIYSMLDFSDTTEYYDIEVDMNGPEMGFCMEADFEKGYGTFHLFHIPKKISIQFDTKNNTFRIGKKIGVYELTSEENGSGILQKKINFFPANKKGEKLSDGYKKNYSLEECLKIKKQNYEADLFTWGTSGAKQHEAYEKFEKDKEEFEKAKKAIEEMDREEKEKEAEENEKLKK